MHFAVVADKMDLSSSERRLEKEKYNFYSVVNKLVYATLTVRENCHIFIQFSISRPFVASSVFLRGTFYAVLLQEMEIISRAESLDYVTAFFRGRRSAWFLLFTARCSRFSEFDTSVICHAVLILCLGSFLLEDMLLGSKYWLSRDKD